MKKNRLYRSRKDRMLGGVCSGLAEYFEIDPVIVRVLFVILTIGPGVGLVGYIILWIIVPQKPLNFENPSAFEVEPEPTGHNANSDNFSFQTKYSTSNKTHGKVLIAAILILVGAFWFLDNIFTFVSFEKLWPLILVAIGIIILMKPRNKGKI